MDYSRYEKLRALVRGSFSSETQRLVDDALAYADEQLAGMTRYDGSPLLEHGAGVACIVISEVGLGRNSTIASVLHDVVRIAHKQQSQEEFLALMNDLRSRFGEQVAGITMGLCNISELKLKVAKEQAGNFRDLIVSYSEDPRVILIKLADRLEVMRSLDIFPREKWRKKSWESMNLYAQIAHKLGLYGLKSELEDIALKYLEPKDYDHIVAKLEESADERRAFIARFIVPIEERLRKLGINYHIKSRTKSIFSIWNKMQKQRVPFEGVYDIFAIRIIIDCPVEEEKRLCWTAYSVVTDYYTPNPNRMRDWISIPKSNGYESLHTTVSAEGRWVEVQIRTERMDAVAERGIAAHWRYKGVGQGARTSEQWLGRLRELLEDTTHSLAQRFDAKPASGEIFVFTPNGDLRKLPEGATLLDFAFDIHTNLGATCSGGKVNNRAVSIREVLHNGDIVEILTQKNQTPKADWLSVVVTSKARNKIKSYLREEQAKHARMGREELERKLKNWKFPLSIDEAVAYLAKYFKVRTGTEVYGLISTQKVELASIKEILSRHLSGAAEEERRAAAAEVERAKAAARETAPARSSDALIIDDDISKIQYKLARCCNPIKGDEVFGFITIGAGITIHRTDCPNARRMRERYPHRVIDARWRSTAEGAFRVSIRIVAADMTGMANHITEVISRDLRLNIRSMNFSAASGGSVEGVVSVEVPGTAAVDTLIHSIMRIRGVQRAYRINN
ncbi:bifunctional (p)ppGpp synthetase/guanosine-3',5'-bis(diphosphate) 3'-pyrophosphohydrolase [uncultured Alistipes sp.]|jgi:GTP pyrophosphokinase|uniref:RelA/SpoT family protein n=1 Tax=uncultured Alistipes sp. TaxID=538949 RepID=UPI001F887576|nr:RelA/SpoT family protein [uncultured Alistipes sp.]HJC18261.1 RelA/SpoT family protein [Candidatus Alistipes stercorigallinarum]